MSIILSRGCEYALQAVIYLAAQEQGKPIHQQTISSALNIPIHFLGKILQTLTHQRLVASFKGKTGGFMLNQLAGEITPYDIITAIDGAPFLDECLLGFPGCHDDHPCPIHHQWKPVKERIMDMMKNQSIEKLGKTIDFQLDFIQELKEINGSQKKIK